MFQLVIATLLGSAYAGGFYGKKGRYDPPAAHFADTTVHLQLPWGLTHTRDLDANGTLAAAFAPSLDAQLLVGPFVAVGARGGAVYTGASSRHPSGEGRVGSRWLVGHLDALVALDLHYVRIHATKQVVGGGATLGRFRSGWGATGASVDQAGVGLDIRIQDTPRAFYSESGVAPKGLGGMMTLSFEARRVWFRQHRVDWAPSDVRGTLFLFSIGV